MVVINNNNDLPLKIAASQPDGRDFNVLSGVSDAG